MCLAEQMLNAKSLTTDAVILAIFKLKAQNISCLVTKTFIYHVYHIQRKMLIIKNSYDKHRRTRNSLEEILQKKNLPNLNKKMEMQIRQQLHQVDLNWLVEDSDRQGYYKLGRVTETSKPF